MIRTPHGSTLGIVGGGQLARMMAVEARRMGRRVSILDPDSASPAAQVADSHISGALADAGAIARLAASCDVVTIDTEHVPAQCLWEIRDEARVSPSFEVLSVVQDRLRQREFLTRNGLPQPKTHAVSNSAELEQVATSVGFPCRLKTRRAGYDGRGQARVRSAADLPNAWRSMSDAAVIAEEHIEFDLEISVLLARGADGDLRVYPIAENTHVDGILHLTRVPARISERTARDARDLATRIAIALDYVGVLAVELFVLAGGELLVNEIAPRPHNSGHFTYGACVTSQFEQHVRAVCGMPLGDPSLLTPVVMLNLLGELWHAGTPDWSAVWSEAGAKLHLYGKTAATKGRKMGHVLVLNPDANTASLIAERIFTRLNTVSVGATPVHTQDQP